MVELHLRPELAAMPLRQLRGSDLSGLYRDLLSNGRRRAGGGLSARTVRYLHTILNRAMADAVRSGEIATNPAGTADPPSSHAARARIFPVWSPAELARFLKSAERDELYVAFRVAATTGLRRGEVLGLRWCDFDSTRQQLQIVQAVVEVAHEPHVTTPKTERSRRLVALDAKTSQLLTQHRARVTAEHPDLHDHALVFATKDQRPIHPAVFSYRFQRRVHLAGLPRIRLHDLRHTHATHALRLGIHPKVVSERLGHSSVMTTLETYSHVVPSMQREAAEAIAALAE